MSHVRIRYTDIPWHGQTVRLVRIANPPHETMRFSQAGEALEPDPNEHLNRLVAEEARKKLKQAGVLLYFDSADLIGVVFDFYNTDAPSFPAGDYGNAAPGWQEMELEARYN